MANTYLDIKLHLVFAVKNRESLLPAHLIPQIHAYISYALNARGHHTIKVGGTENHVHILFSYSAKELLPDMVRDIKTAVTNHINSHHMIPFKFGWQTGYACFSVSSYNIERVKNYIMRQFEHHKGTSLQTEIKNMLDRCGLDYTDTYLFQEI